MLQHFHGTLVGTLLGEAVAVRIRGVDVAAVVAMLILAVVAVADVLYLNVRDRAREFAALRATGWTEQALARLVIIEGLVLGVIGATVGAAAGLAGAAWLAGDASAVTALVPAAAITTSVGILLTGLGLLMPIAALRRQPTVRLLVEE